MSSKSVRSISEAINTLVEASEQELINFKSKIKGDIKDMGPHIEDSLKGFSHEAQKNLTLFQNKALSTTKDAARSINKFAHEKPWLITGIVSLIAGILGAGLFVKLKK